MPSFSNETFRELNSRGAFALGECQRLSRNHHDKAMKFAKDQIAELLNKIVSLSLPFPFLVFRNEEEKCFATNFVRRPLPFLKEQWNSIVPI